MVENRVVRENSQAVLKLGGNLVASAVPEVRAALKKLIADGVLTLVVDLSNVTILDSMGIGCLVAAHNLLAKSDGNLALINASLDVFELLQAMRLDRHFSISVAEPGEE